MFQRGFDGSPIVGRGDDLNNAFVVHNHIFRARFQRGFHQRVFIHIGKHQIALVHEIKRHAAVCAQIAAVFGERVAHIGNGAGFVVGHAVHHQGCAADAVAFVAQFHIIHAFQIARAFVYRALHVVFGHIGIPCFVHSKAQAGVGCGVATALLGGYGDFFNQFGKNFAALGIDAGFFVLDIRPFAVSSHVGLREIIASKRVILS